MGSSLGPHPGTARDSPPSSGTKRISPLATEAATKRPSGETGDSDRLPQLANRSSSDSEMRRTPPLEKLVTLATLRPCASLANTSTPSPSGSHRAAVTMGKPVSIVRSLPAAVGIATTVPPRMASAQFPSRESSCGSP